MASSWIITSGTTYSFDDNTTRYFYPAGDNGQSVTGTATEVNAQAPIRLAGTFSNLYTRVLSNTAAVPTDADISPVLDLSKWS